MSSILNVFISLKSEYEEASKNLKVIEDDIKKLTGREPSLAKASTKRSTKAALDSDTKELEEGEIVNDEPIKRSKFIYKAFSRVYGPKRKRERSFESEEEEEEEEELTKRLVLQSQVIAAKKETKPRHQVIEEQQTDTKNMARSRRMFGMILGTLQKFQTEESRRKETTQKRVEIEKKLEQAAEEEKANLKKERKELYKIQREKQAEIRRIEFKIERLSIHQEWEKSHKFLANYIQTKTKPHIFFMPVEHNSESERRLKETKDKYRLILAEKRAKVQKELSDIDDLYKKSQENFEDYEENDDDHVRIKDNEIIKETTEKSKNDSKQDNHEREKTIKMIHSEADSLTFDDDDDKRMVKNDSTSDLAEKEFEPIYDE